MFFTPKLPGGDTSLIGAQLRAISDKIDTIASNYTTRQDMASLQAAIESRFLERAVATEKFDNIDKRLEAIEKQLNNDEQERREHGFITRNNVVYWLIGIVGTLYATINLLLYLASHLKP